MSKKWTDSILIKASRYYKYGNALKALEWFLKGAKAGNVGCMLNAGVLYGEGASGIIDTTGHATYTDVKASVKHADSGSENFQMHYGQLSVFRVG